MREVAVTELSLDVVNLFKTTMRPRTTTVFTLARFCRHPASELQLLTTDYMAGEEIAMRAGTIGAGMLNADVCKLLIRRTACERPEYLAK